eukprot:gene2276-2491_t
MSNNEIAYYDQNQQLTDPYGTGEGNTESEGVDYFPPPEGVPHDEMGRLLKDPEDIIDPETLPEEIPKFISLFQKQKLTAMIDWPWTSQFLFPTLPRVVILKRLDVYQQDRPYLQYATSDRHDSLSVRRSGSWYPLRSLFFLDGETENSCKLMVESAGPPRRSKYRLSGKENKRDLVKWVLKETLHCYQDPHFAKGTARLYIDYCDLPDRYFISSQEEPGLGLRRLYSFATYPATQYYILEKRIHHEALDSEGGWGSTYWIEAGPILYARQDWRVIGSFYGFDHQLPSSALYTVYRRWDPFPRVHIAREVIQNADQWQADFQFYAFDIAIPGTMKYSIHHCLRSIYTNVASVPRHRMTTEDHRTPWEFRMNVFVFPASLDDCTIVPYNYRELQRQQNGALDTNLMRSYK